MTNNTHTAFITGASGATGKHLTRILLEKGYRVKAVVRSPDKLLELADQYDALELIQGTVLEMTNDVLDGHLKDCNAAASCLGHNLSFKGMYGKPRRLVRDSLIRVSESIQRLAPIQPVKIVLMNTTGNRNPDVDLQTSVAHRIVLTLLRLLVPPHVDNEQAAEYLRTGIGRDNRYVEWCVVRPDALVDEDTPSAYSLHPSPTSDPIFNAGRTSRINVADFISSLITNDEDWMEWKGQMPVIYNSDKTD